MQFDVKLERKEKNISAISVYVPVCDGARDGDAQRGGLAAAASSRERDRAAKCFLGNGIEEREHRLGLVERARDGHQRAGGRRVLQRRLQLLQLGGVRQLSLLHVGQL